MIYGYRFNFMDEPGLRAEYDAFFGEESAAAPLVSVVAARGHALLSCFTEKSAWVSLSGQEGRTLAPVPVESLDGTTPWALEIANVLTLVWRPEASRIEYIKAEGYSPERLRFWVFHTFFPMVLNLGGTYHVLHVGAVEIRGYPVLFSAPSFGGKSTLTGYFARMGHPLYADDSLAIEKRGNRFHALPSYPYHRPYRKPETLGDSVEKMAKTPEPIQAVFSLEKTEAHVPVKIVELQGIEKFRVFHFTDFISLAFRKKERFDYFTELARTIPAYKISLPWDLKRLPEVYTAIVSALLPFAEGKGPPPPNPFSGFEKK